MADSNTRDVEILRRTKGLDAVPGIVGNLAFTEKIVLEPGGS